MGLVDPWQEDGLTNYLAVPSMADSTSVEHRRDPWQVDRVPNYLAVLSIAASTSRGGDWQEDRVSNYLAGMADWATGRDPSGR